MNLAIASKYKGKTDEWLTPESAIYPLLPYIKPNSLIWCPFDKEDSAFVKVLSTEHKVFYTHIDNQQDFFVTNLEMCDYIISNPPYSIREFVFERLFKLNKPFAMLINYAGLWDNQKRFDLFKKYGIELLILKGRTKFINPYKKSTGSPMFQSIYLCHNMLPERIVYQ